jgi:hypothetical protein
VSTPARYLLLAQVGFFLALAVCVVIEPEGLNDNHGWSFYEGRADTAVPYVLGLVCGIALILYASALVERSPSASGGLATGLQLLAFFLFLDVATPDTVDAFFYWAHDLTSALLFLYQLGFALWLVRSVWRTRAGVILVGVQFLGGLVAMFSQLQLIPLLGLGILVFQVSFGTLLVCAVARLPGSARVDEPRARALPVRAS